MCTYRIVVCTSACAYVYVSVCVHTHTNTHTHTHACMHVWIHARMSACMDTCAYVCTYAYMRVCMHVGTTNIHFKSEFSLQNTLFPSLGLPPSPPLPLPLPLLLSRSPALLLLVGLFTALVGLVSSTALAASFTTGQRSAMGIDNFGKFD